MKSTEARKRKGGGRRWSYFACSIVLILLAAAGCTSVSDLASDSALLNWTYDPSPLIPQSNGNAFGNVVYDPVNRFWRMYYTNYSGGTTHPAIYQVTGTTPSAFGNPTLALGPGVLGSWDCEEVGVPFAWYEQGQARPWRMMYRGRGLDNYFSIGLATSIDGETWLREDTDGNPFPVISISSVENDGSGQIEVTTAAAQPWSTGSQIVIGGVIGTGAPSINNNTIREEWIITVIDGQHFVLQGSTYKEGAKYQGGIASQPVLRGTPGAWDGSTIDFGSVIKIGSLYYLFYDTITLNLRRTGLATSADLVNWAKDPDNPLFSGADGYVDSTTPPGEDQNGTTDAIAGFFCPDVVYWPEADGSTRYVMIIPHYISGGSLKPTYDLYVSANPSFHQADRRYLGKILRADVNPPYFEGQPLTKTDTPRIITDDITRNVATSVRTGNQVLLAASIYTVSSNWNHVLLVHNR